LSAVVGFPVGEPLPVPILVAFCACCHVLSPPGKHLVFVRDVLRKQKIEPGLAGLRIPHPPALELLADDLLADLDCRVLSHSLSAAHRSAIDWPASLRPYPPLGLPGISHGYISGAPRLVRRWTTSREGRPPSVFTAPPTTELIADSARSEGPLIPAFRTM